MGGSSGKPRVSSEATTRIRKQKAKLSKAEQSKAKQKGGIWDKFFEAAAFYRFLGMGNTNRKSLASLLLIIIIIKLLLIRETGGKNFS